MPEEMLCEGEIHVYNPHVQVCQCGKERWPQPGRKNMAQGWMCPQCGVIYAPQVTTCEQCKTKGEMLRK